MNESTAATTTREEGVGDLLYDAFYGAAVGGATIALFFLVVDALQGRVLFTPSLMGTVLLTGAVPETVTAVRIDMVAYFSAIHLAGFLGLGAAISFMCRATGVSKSHLPAVATAIFVLLNVGFFGADVLVMGGVASVIGVPLVVGANLLTALAMAFFIKKAHEGEPGQPVGL